MKSLKTDDMRIVGTLILMLIMGAYSYGQHVQSDTTENLVHQVVSKNDHEPLYFLDGEEITAEEMKSVKSSDIQEVTVFKDSTATRQYGLRARNGVIVIKSKNQPHREK